MQNKYNLGMYDKNTKESVSFVPRHLTMNIQESVEDSPMDEPCPPSKIFQRHGSLAELSTIAVTEKQALDRQENSQCSDSSESSATVDVENDSQGQQFGCLSQNLGAQLEVHSTPTKVPTVENTPCNDPLTPTANLKVLMSVVSPAIRDRDEKKRDLFVNNAGNMTDEVVIEKPNSYSRKDKSLGLLCQRFLAMFPEDPGDKSIEISLDEISKDLKVERRRVYDIVNVLESVEVLSRLAKNRYVWHGKSRIVQTLGKLKALSRNSIYKTHQKEEKENFPNTPSSGKQKMKRYSSCGDLPKPNAQLKDRILTKEEERMMIK
ncbi:transcription factor E2F7-like, partial [Paramuricea clavata]